mmetsp:Transcript_149440/g.362977  ORF Transcript_149440/g.362977 Transcript_149440/m.362977 type:complete len:237 (+) Transcript_149440:1356-2066(+)
MLAEQRRQSLLGHVEGQILHEHVGPVVGRAARLALLEGADVHGLALDAHTVHLLDRLLGGLDGLELDKAVPARLARGTVDGDLARQDVPKQRECVEQSLVVNVLVQVLDKDVARAGLAHGWVTLRPHDAARFAHDRHVVHSVEGTLSIVVRVEVNVRIAQRAARDRVTADTDGRHRPDGVEDFEELGLGACDVEVAHIERRGLLREARGAGSGGAAHGRGGRRGCGRGGHLGGGSG